MKTPPSTTFLQDVEISIISAQEKAFQKIKNTLFIMRGVLKSEPQIKQWYLSKIRASRELIAASEYDLLHLPPHPCITTLGHNQFNGRISFTFFIPIHKPVASKEDDIDCAVTITQLTPSKNKWQQIVIVRNSDVPVITRDDSFFPDSFWITSICDQMQSSAKTEQVLKDYIQQHED